MIDRDGRILSTVGHGGGSCTVSLIAPVEVEFIYSESADPFMIAIDSQKKS